MAGDPNKRFTTFQRHRGPARSGCLRGDGEVLLLRVRDWQSRNSPAWGDADTTLPRAQGTTRRDATESADLAVAVLAPGRQFVLRSGNRLAAVGSLAGKSAMTPVSSRIAPDTAMPTRPAACSRSTTSSRCAFVDGRAVGEQGDVGQILDATLAQMVNCDTDVVQRDAGVKQSLDDLENQDVLNE